MFTVVLSIELVEELLNMLLNSSCVFPLNNSDSVGSGIVVEPLPRAVLDSKIELSVAVEIVGATPTSTGIEVLLEVVPTICSTVLVGILVLVDGISETSSIVVVIVGALVELILVEVLGRTFVLVLVLEGLFNESALSSKF